MRQHRLGRTAEEPTGESICRRAADHDQISVVGPRLFKDPFSGVTLDDDRGLPLETWRQTSLELLQLAR